MAKNNRETDIQMALCKYVSHKYPRVLFNVDLSGMNLSKAQAGIAKMMRSSKGYPDFVMYEPRGKYHGLFLELKAEGTKLRKVINDPVAPYRAYTPTHIAEQVKMLSRLSEKGYFAVFAIGLDVAMTFVDEYMKLEKSAS